MVSVILMKIVDIINNVKNGYYVIPDIQRILDESHVETIYLDQQKDIEDGLGLTILQSISVCIFDNKGYVIDGQHRIKVFDRLIKEGYEIGNIDVPMVKYDVLSLEEVYSFYRKINMSRKINNFELSNDWIMFGKSLCQNMKNSFPSYFTYLRSGSRKVNIPKLSFENFEIGLERRSRCLSGMSWNVVFEKILKVNEYLAKSKNFLCEDETINKFLKCESCKKDTDYSVFYLPIFGDESHAYLDIVIWMITNNSDELRNVKFRDFTKRRTIPQNIRKKVWGKVNSSSDGICYVCSLPLSYDDFHCGHIVSKYLGGSDNVDNLLPICLSCNLSIGIQNLYEYKNKYF
jgi:hypothetical protein